MTYVEMKL